MSARADLKLGFACNNRCVFCAQGEKRRHTGVIPKAECAERLLRGFRPGSGLVLTGGEPTLRKDLVELVRLAARIGYSPIQVQTNGRMLSYEPLVRALVEAGASEFSPALHGPTPEVHDALTRAAGSFVETTRGIQNALASGAVVLTNTVVVRQNLARLAETIDVLADLGVRRAQLALVHPVGTAEERFDEVVPRLSEAAPALAAAVRHGRARGVSVVVEAMPPCLLRGLEDAVVEEAIPETTVIDADGEAFAFSAWRRGEGKQKGPPCVGCARNAQCEGPWREYPARFGWSELMPYAAGE